MKSIKELIWVYSNRLEEVERELINARFKEDKTIWDKGMHMLNQVISDLLKESTKHPRGNYTIAVGGPIGVGKTTFCNKLKDKFGYKIIKEIPEDPNHIFNHFLNDMYKNKNKSEREKNYSAFAFQSLMVGYRTDELQKQCWDVRVFDRCILEDRFFASKLITDGSLLEKYNQIWYEEVNKLYHANALPDVYIIMEPDYEGQTLESIKQRGRKCEIDEYELNKDYYLEIEKEYTNYLTKVCDEFNVRYVVCKRNSAELKMWLLENE